MTLSPLAGKHGMNGKVRRDTRASAVPSGQITISIKSQFDFANLSG